VKKSVLELGGSDPFVVMPSADLEGAIKTAVDARLVNAGQSCISAKRFIIHDAIFDEFMAGFTAAMSTVVMGDPFVEGTQLGPVSTAGGRSDLVELVEDARAKGATIVTGGTLPDGPGFFYPATIITDVTPAMRLHREETFGPVATVYRVKSVDEALALANVTDFGLSSAVWTNDAAERARFETELEAGAVFVNGMTISYPELPFGGIKNSGFGRELAAAGIREFCNLKTVWER
jgi:succinate-semialdehyde dehydrogenase/glutarate-semialdehyde dehydrogenase